MLSIAYKSHNKTLQLTNNTPLRSVLWSTEFKRYAQEEFQLIMRYILIIITIMFTGILQAESLPEEKSKLNYVLTTVSAIVAVEAMFGINAWMASESPKVYGGFSALLFPFAGAGAGEASRGKITYLSGVLAAESISIYNLSLDEDKESKSDIFNNNMIAWHIFLGVISTAFIVENKYFNQENISFIPAKMRWTNCV